MWFTHLVCKSVLVVKWRPQFLSTGILHRLLQCSQGIAAGFPQNKQQGESSTFNDLTSEVTYCHL